MNCATQTMTRTSQRFGSADIRMATLAIERVHPERSPLARHFRVEREAELRHHVARRLVLLDRYRDKALEAELTERPVDARPTGLRRDSFPPPRRVERPAD